MNQEKKDDKEKSNINMKQWMEQEGREEERKEGGERGKEGRPIDGSKCNSKCGDNFYK